MLLRNYQLQGVNDIRAQFESGKRAVLYTLPTGGGKTIMFCHIAREAKLRGTRVGILLHRDVLVEQVFRSLNQFGVSHGLIVPTARQTKHDVQVASVQTLGRRLDRYRFDLIIIDEAHAFKTLLDRGGYTVEALAERVDKSVGHVRRSVRLLGLPEKVIEAIEAGEITASHGTVIGRLQDKEEQVSFLQAIIAKKLSAKAAENALADRARDLAKAAFNTKACAKCPSSGKKQEDLFNADTDLAGRCMNPACFDGKTRAAKGEPEKKRKTESKASSSGTQSGFLPSIEAIVENVRKDTNLGYMRLLAGGILRNADDRVKYEFMRRRDPAIKKGDADRDIRKYLGKLTDFFIPGFCVEMMILTESSVQAGELVHEFKKLYGIGKDTAASPAPEKSVQDALKQLGAQMGKDEKVTKKESK